MSFPPHVAEAIGDHLDLPPAPGGFYALADEVCEGARFHSPKPLVLLKVSIRPGKPQKGDETATLCPTCAANFGLLQNLLVATDGNLSWPTRREFGNQLRALALTGWTRYRGKRRG